MSEADNHYSGSVFASFVPLRNGSNGTVTTTDPVAEGASLGLEQQQQQQSVLRSPSSSSPLYDIVFYEPNRWSRVAVPTTDTIFQLNLDLATEADVIEWWYPSFLFVWRGSQVFLVFREIPMDGSVIRKGSAFSFADLFPRGDDADAPLLAVSTRGAFEAVAALPP